MTPMRTAYRFFRYTLGLLVLYALVSVIAELKFLPGDFTQTSLPFHQVSTFAAALLDLVVVGGLLGSGIYAMRTPDQSVRRLRRFAVLLWSLLVILTVAAGILNLLLAGSALLAMLKVFVIALVVGDIARHLHAWTPIPLVWTVGMVLSVIGTLIGLIPTHDFMLAVVLHTFASGVNTYIAYVLAAVALVFWLIPRFSNMTPLRAGRSLNTVAGLLALAGGLIMLSGLGLSDSWFGSLSALLVPLIYLIFAAHIYRAFSNHNPTNTPAAHWMALGVLLLLLSVGMLGSVQAAIHLWTMGTRLSDLQPTLALLAIVAIILGMLSQVVAEMQDQNHRVIGLAPFWFVAFGSVGGALTLAGAGLVQVYLERILSIGYLNTQALIEPLYKLWVLGGVLLALGVMLYTLIFWLRRLHPH
ncbi:MAG: hypothetical protein ABI700_05970 [Chloroflexota bacterium]